MVLRPAVRHIFSLAARAVSDWTGTVTAFLLAFNVILIWFVAGFWIGFGDTTYQLVINTATTIVTFLMVFIMQHTQNRDTRALHAKVDELIRVSAARNELMGIERRPEADLP